MAKMKVYELAKEMDKQSKDVINYLKDQGVEVKSHMSSIEDSSVSLVKKHFEPNTNVANLKIIKGSLLEFCYNPILYKASINEK